MNNLFTIFAIKQAKRDPWSVIDKTGKPTLIDDGVNHQISLFSNAPENLADFFLANMKKQYHGKAWKIWKEQV